MSGFRLSSCALVMCALSPTALAQSYSLVGTYAAPSGAMDVLPDGRLISVAGNTVLVQDSINSPGYSPIGSVQPGFIREFSFGVSASFLSVNPSGTTLAIGDNDFGSGNPQDVLLIDLASLSTLAPTTPATIGAANTSGAWADDTTLYTSGSLGADGLLTRIDTLTSGSTVVVDGLNGASGGVAINDGVVYTGNGFGFGSGLGFEATGAIAGFDLASLSDAASPVAFSSGTLAATALSAGSLDFDADGNLIVGGSDSFSGGEGGFVSVIPAGAFPNATSANGEQLFPAGGAFGFPSALYNPATEEILVRDGGVIYRYAVPAPGAVVLFAIGAASRRRRTRG